MTATAARMQSLRAAIKNAGLDGWYVGREDMFQGEEVPPSEERGPKKIQKGNHRDAEGFQKGNLS